MDRLSRDTRKITCGDSAACSQKAFGFLLFGVCPGELEYSRVVNEVIQKAISPAGLTFLFEIGTAVAKRQQLVLRTLIEPEKIGYKRSE